MNGRDYFLSFACIILACLSSLNQAQSCSSSQFVVRSNNGQDYLTINSPTEVRTCGGINICDEINQLKESLSLHHSLLDAIRQQLDEVKQGQVGMIVPHGLDTVPPGWLLCDGRAVSRTVYSRLFDVLQSVYGPGDGSNTFNLPDLRGRTVVGSGQGTGLTNRLQGARLGQENHVLSADELPAHFHTGTTQSGKSMSYRVQNPNNPAGVFDVGPGFFAGHTGGGEVIPVPPNTANTRSDVGAFERSDNQYTGSQHLHDFTTNSAGGGSAHNNMQPSLVLNYVIKF